VGADVVWSVTVPPNSMATLPVASSKQYSMTLDGQPIEKSSKVNANGSGYELPAGTYFFKGTMKTAVTATSANGSI
jgi:hypothetical protein